MKFPKNDNSLSRNISEDHTSSMMNNNSRKIIFTIIITAVLVTSATSISFADDFSLLQQIRNGVFAENIECKENLVLVIKNNGNPACVKEDHVFRLLQTGWATKVIPEKIDSTKQTPHNMTDTWYPQDSINQESVRSSQAQSLGSGSFAAAPGANTQSYALSESANLGFAVGGAQDIVLVNI